MVKNYCHAAGGHQTQNSVGSNAEVPVIEEQRVESGEKSKQNEFLVVWRVATKRYP
jgi:hypothetical protein